MSRAELTNQLPGLQRLPAKISKQQNASWSYAGPHSTSSQSASQPPRPLAPQRASQP